MNDKFEREINKGFEEGYKRALKDVSKMIKILIKGETKWNYQNQWKGSFYGMNLIITCFKEKLFRYIPHKLMTELNNDEMISVYAYLIENEVKKNV